MVGIRMGRLSGAGVVVPLAAGQVMIHENKTNTCEDLGERRRDRKAKGTNSESEASFQGHREVLSHGLEDQEECPAIGRQVK